MNNNMIDLDVDDPSDVLRQLDRTRALRRQSVIRARRESGGGLDHSHHHGTTSSDHHHDDGKAHSDDDDDDDDEADDEDKPAAVNGIGTGLMRYQYMTPDDFSDTISMGSADILAAFKGLTSTHGIPHVSNAHGKQQRVSRP